MKRIHVVAAVIHGDCCGRPGELFIAKRPDNVHKGGLWEFPGGKVDEGEAPREALVRELQEELGIETSACQRLVETHHDYPDKQIHLEFWDVTEFEGEPHGAEGQPVKWVKPHELGNYPFPEANQAVVQRLMKHSQPPALHKGYLWALAVALLVGAWLYFGDSTRDMDEQQKFYYWTLQESTPKAVAEFAEQYDLETLQEMCRLASGENQHEALLLEKPAGETSGVMGRALTSANNTVCSAFAYKLKLTKILHGDFEGLTF